MSVEIRTWTQRRERLLTWMRERLEGTGQSTRMIALYFEGGTHSQATVRRDLRALEAAGFVTLHYQSGVGFWRPDTERRG